MAAAVDRQDGPSRDMPQEMAGQTVAANSVPASLVSSDMLNGHGQLRSASEGLPNLADGDAKCGGCSEVIDQEHGGTVVAFG